MAGNIYWQNLSSSKIEVIGNIFDNPELLSEYKYGTDERL